MKRAPIPDQTNKKFTNNVYFCKSFHSVGSLTSQADRVVLSLSPFASVQFLICSVLFGSDRVGKRQSLFIVCRWKDRVPCLAKELANQGSEQQISCRLPPCFYQISLLYVVLLLQRIAKFLAPTSTLAGAEYVKLNEICLGIGSYQRKNYIKKRDLVTWRRVTTDLLFTTLVGKLFCQARHWCCKPGNWTTNQLLPASMLLPDLSSLCNSSFARNSKVFSSNIYLCWWWICLKK